MIDIVPVQNGIQGTTALGGGLGEVLYTICVSRGRQRNREREEQRVLTLLPGTGMIVREIQGESPTLRLVANNRLHLSGRCHLEDRAVTQPKMHFSRNEHPRHLPFNIFR